MPKIELIPLDVSNTDHVSLMFIVRTHPEVIPFLRGAPPSDFNRHLSYLQNLREDKKVFLVQEESSLCGYCQMSFGEKYIEIGIALHPKYCNRGIGSFALDRLLTFLSLDSRAQNKEIVLFVKKENARAVALYRKYGFSICGVENEFGEYPMKKMSSSLKTDDPAVDCSFLVGK